MQERKFSNRKEHKSNQNKAEFLSATNFRVHCKAFQSIMPKASINVLESLLAVDGEVYRSTNDPSGTQMILQRLKISDLIRMTR